MKNKTVKYVIDSRHFRGSCLTSMSDGIHNDYGGETLEELRAGRNNPFLIAVTPNTIHKMARIHEKSLCGPFLEITEEDYYDSMGVLPPIRLKGHSFFVGEPYHGTLYAFCFTIGKRYFKGLRSVMTPQSELERQMDEHYRHIMFRGKIIREQSYTIGSKEQPGTTVTPYSFIDAEGEKRFICNRVARRKDTAEIHKARKDMAGILLSLRRHHFLYFSNDNRHDDMEKFMDGMEKKGYTLLANGRFFQYPVNRESVSFTGSVKETGETFLYRIYNRELFLHLLQRLRSVKRETIEVKP